MARTSLVGWILVGVAAAILAMTTYFVGGFAAGYGPTTGVWLDGAGFGLNNALAGIVPVVILSVVALIFGRGVWVRVVAVILIVLSVLGPALAGGSAALGRYADAPKAPQCEAMGPSMPDEVVEALAELEHPGWVDTLSASTTGCGIAVRNLSSVQAIDHYEDQLIDGGWEVSHPDGVSLVAVRDGVTLTISDCGSESWLEVRTDDTPLGGGCEPTSVG